MESSSRNSNRTTNRNDGALISLSEKLESPRFGFFYQYCNNNRCREVTLFILPLPRTIEPLEKLAFQTTVEQTGVPGLILEFPDEEVVRATCLTGNKEVVYDSMEWGTILRWLHNKQVDHERKSKDAECANYTHQPLNKGTWQSTTESTKFSNEARAVPGVRHIDVDGIFHCPDCMNPLFAVEATSDGCPGTPMEHKRKATSMTRKVAGLLNATPLLIQHHYEDVDHEKPVYLTSWSSGQMRRYNRTWDTLVADFHTALERHRREACSAHERG